MLAGFQCWADAWGNLHMTAGVVFQPSTGARFYVGSDGGIPAEAEDNSGGEFVAVQAAKGTVFLGGNGRNLVASGLVPEVSGPAVPVGLFRPNEPGFFRMGGFVIEVIDADTATLSDGVDVVGNLTAVGAAPVGDFVATTYGEDTYNGGDPFTITVAAESATTVAIPDAELTVSAGSATEGTLVAVDGATFEIDGATDWTVVCDPDGSAELRYLGDAMATRAEGSGWNPAGIYEATALGKATFNLTADEPVDGEPWQAVVRLVPRRPRAGIAYLNIVETGGEVTAVNGPFFGTMPSSAGSDFYVPMAVSDGLGGLEQLHTGMLVWPGAQQPAPAIAWGTVAANTAAGAAGDARMDGSYLYGCVATDTWGRVAWDLTPWGA